MLRRLLLFSLAAVAVEAETVTVGLTRTGKVIEAAALRATAAGAPTVVLIGGFEGAASAQFVSGETSRYQGVPPARRQFHLLAITAPNPDGARMIFPPAGVPYRENTESHYLYRWLQVRAPDLVLIAGQEDNGLAQTLASSGIPARKVEPRPGLLRGLAAPAPSEAARELAARLARKPREIAQELEPHYGHSFEQAVYIPALALIARTRLGFLDDVQKIVAPFLSGERDSLAKPTGSHLAGHLIFAELAERTRDKRYIDLVTRAANQDLAPLHHEMSDAVFMACPILAKAGKLTGDRRYFDMAQRHLRFMQKLCLRSDGLYRHSPLGDAAWGRGNAFPALGLALALSDTPRDHPAFDEMRQALRDHLTALSRHQDENGMWRQVIDVRGAYPEFSATAMIGTAMLRAVRRGWLDGRTFQPRVDAAWLGVLARVRAGRLTDVCESTGKLPTLQQYLDRVAISGEDARGGAMALLFATEMAALE
jgi:rhamnogalacturonyl hydrolase YesR